MLPADASVALSAHTPASASTTTLIVRPGLLLAWSHRHNADDFPLPRAGALWLRFVLGADTARHRDRMVFAGPSGAATHDAVESSDAFHVVLVLAPPTLDELTADPSTPGVDAILARLAEPTAPPLVLPLTAPARLAIESIRRCPFAGACRNVALAARANDLLLEFLHALAAPPPTASNVVLRSLRTQIESAAGLLTRDLEHPPTVSELSRHVGLSESSLKRGFHQVFGSTVFGYLRSRRMAHARSLLQSGDATVLEAAAAVGYSNPSNFAAAFRREFGVNPKTFQLNGSRQ
jgi:AraC-like DNA-binding protein